MQSRHSFRLPIFLALVTGTATAALAQTQEAPDTGMVGDIVVTAQKRSESAQDIPVSVSALGGEILQKQGVKDLFQAVTLVPGVVFSRAPDDGLALTFRGLGTQARPQAFEQSVALFTDGIFIGKGRLYSTSFFDVERMEFIKGTQSTLLGKNASTGAISVITRQPTFTNSVEGGAGYEFENGGYTADLAGNIALGEKAAIRLAGHYNDLDGWVRNVVTDHDGPEAKDLGLRATLLVEPSDQFRMTASYQYADNRRIGTNYQIVGTPAPGLGDGILDDKLSAFTSATSDGDSHKRTRSHIAGLKAELDVGGGNTLISQTSYIRYKLSFRDDFDFTTFDSINFLRDERYRQFTQELRLQSESGGTFEYMGGLFFLSSRWNSEETQAWGVPAFPPAPDPTSGQLFNGPFHNSFRQNAKAYSAFASGTLHASESLRIAGGVRYTRETKDVLYGRTNSAPFTIWNSIANPPFDPTPLSHNSNFFDGNISVQYDLSDQVMAYAAFGHGSKSGGYVESNTIAVPPTALVNGKVPAALVAAGSEIPDEFTTSYEIGFKTTLLDRRMRFNVALFNMDIKNFQDTVFTGGPLGFITFTGPARSRGVEIETAFQPVPELRLDGSVTYADAVQKLQPIDATGTPVVDGSGNPVIQRFRRSQAPKLIFNIGANYTNALTDALKWSAGFNVRHRSSMYNQRQEQYRANALTTVDLSIGIAQSEDRWGIDLVAKNIFNKKSQDFASPSVDPRTPALAGVNPLRTIMLSARFKY